MTQVKLLPSDGRRQRKEERQGNDSSSNIKLRPATTTTTTPRGRKERTPRNSLDLKNLPDKTPYMTEGMRPGRSFYDNVRVSEARPSSGSRRTSGSKSASKRDRPRSRSPKSVVVDEDLHGVSLRPAQAGGGGGGRGTQQHGRGSKRQGVQLHSSQRTRRKTSGGKGGGQKSWFDDDPDRTYSESSEDYVRIMGRGSDGSTAAYPKSILLSIRSAEELLSEVEANLQKMDFTVVTTALAQAVRLGCNGEDPRIAKLENRCCELLKRRQQPRRADEIISSLHCVLELSSNPANCGQILAASTTAVSSRLRECTGDDLSNLCRCICKAEYLCPSLLTSITEECMARSSELEPADISTIAWGLAKMGFGSDVLFHRLARVVEVTTHLFSGAYLSNLMWAFASVGYRSESMLAAVAQRCQDLMAAVIGPTESADADVDRMPLHPMEMSTLVWALSRLHAPSAEQFYLMVCEYTTCNISNFKASELCTLVTGISRVSWKGDGQDVSSDAAAALNPGQLPQACRQMFQKCAEYVSSSPLPAVGGGDASPQASGGDKGVCFSDKQVRIFVTALAKVGLSHTRLFECAQQRSDRRMTRQEAQVGDAVCLTPATSPQRVSLVRSVEGDKGGNDQPVGRMYDIVDVAELELLVAAQERSLQGPEGASLSLDHFRRQLQKARPQSSTIKWRRFLEDTLIANSKKLKERQRESTPPLAEVPEPGIEPATSESVSAKGEDIVPKSTPTPGSSSSVVLPTGQPLVINVQAPAPSPPGSLNSTGELALLHTAELEVLRRALLGAGPGLLNLGPQDGEESAAKTEREERLEKQVEELGNLARTQQQLLEQLMTRIQEMNDRQSFRSQPGRQSQLETKSRDAEAGTLMSVKEDSPDSLKEGRRKKAADYDEMPLPTQRRASPDDSPPLRSNAPTVAPRRTLEMSIPSSSRFLTLNERAPQESRLVLSSGEFEESPGIGRSEAVQQQQQTQGGSLQLLALEPPCPGGHSNESDEARQGGPTNGLGRGSLSRIPEEGESHGDGSLCFNSPKKIVVNPGRKTPSFKFSEDSTVRESDDISEVPLHTGSCSSSLGDPWVANLGTAERGSGSTLEALIAEGESLLSSGDQQAHANLVRATPVFGSGRSSASISIEMKGDRKTLDNTIEPVQVEERDPPGDGVPQCIREHGSSEGTDLGKAGREVTKEGSPQSAQSSGALEPTSGEGLTSFGGGPPVEGGMPLLKKSISAVSLDDKENYGGSGNLSIHDRSDGSESSVLVLAAWKPSDNHRYSGGPTSEPLKVPVGAQDPPLRLSYAPPPHWGESRIGKAAKKAAEAEPGSTPMSASEPTGSPDFLTGDDFLAQPSPSPSEVFPPGGSPAGSSLLTTESKSQYTHVVALRPRPGKSSKSPARYNCRPRFRDLASARKSQHEVSVHSRTSVEWSRVMENRLKHAKEEGFEFCWLVQASTLSMTEGREDIARARVSKYQQFFASNLFESTTVEARPKYSPLGRPADQTTAEMFGDYEETDRPSRKDVVPEFVPRQPYASAHEKKLQEFRGSELLATESAAAGYALALSEGRKAADKSHADCREVLAKQGAAGLRQYHLRSDGVIPGEIVSSVHTLSSTPDNTIRTVPHEAPLTNRLMAANETWYSVATAVGKSKVEDSTVAAKADRERNSSVMDLPREHSHGRSQAEPKAAADPVAEEKRRNNMMYSDLFGRATPDCAGQEAAHQRLYRAKPRGFEAASMRDSGESTSAASDAEKGMQRSPGRDRPNGVGKSRLSGEGLFMEDNSSKVAWDEANRDQSDACRVRQNHLRSSVHIGDMPSGSPSGSPPRSPEVNDWNITELAVSGLKENTDELAFRRDVMPGDCHIVKTSLNMDLVGGRCLGGAKVLVRHNPKSEDLKHVLEELNSKGYGVKLLSTAKPN
ncbi:hypothetical protein FOL46_004457 [Perkinsus olseni]|uniref:RAP domain-containing protein n=1 Tax=Perkinsus olseni TaxID=32597 RepID=A0A7J6LXQ9_PEROL|nr:hypothetical protein FOL46_004457 [Perkinsus olseni]